MSEQEQFIQSFIQYLTGVSSIEPPASFTTQVMASKTIINSDYTGLIRPVIDFVADAILEVNWKIESGNDELNKVLNLWLLEINKDKKSDIQSGFKAFVRECVYEYFTSGLIITKTIYAPYKGIELPMKIWLLDSENITVQGDDDTLDYQYFLNGTRITGNYYVRKDGRWYDKYPTPYLIRRGIYPNYILKKTLKQKSQEVLKEVLWYLFQGLFPGNDRVASEEDYSDKAKQFKDAIDSSKEALDSTSPKIPAFFGKSGTEFKHILPDLKPILSTEIYSQLDRDILSGMGLIEIIQGVTSTRKESVLNPKPLVQQAVGILSSLDSLLLDILRDTIAKNNTHKKYFSDISKIKIVRTPLKAFWSQEFKEFVRSFYDRGLLSYESTLDSIDFDVNTERERINRETIKGDEVIFYPKVLTNQEANSTLMEDLKKDMMNLEEKENITEDKKGLEKENYKSSLEIAPYKTKNDLPEKIRKNLSDSVAKIFIKVFNRTYESQKDNYNEKIAEELAFKTAWSAVRKVAKKNSKNVWVLKKSMIRAKQIIIDLEKEVDNEIN